MNRDLTPAEIMEAYRAAHEAANGRSIEITYAGGWYRVTTGGGFSTPFRAKQIKDFTARLLARAK